MEALSMPHSRDFDAVPIKPEDETHDNVWLDDLDDLPLSSRRKLLLEIKTRSGKNCLGSGVREEENENAVFPRSNVDVKTEDFNSDSEIQNLLPSASQTHCSPYDHTCDPDAQPTKPEDEIHEIVWSNELDHVPLITRKKMLLAMKAHSRGEQLETQITEATSNGKPMPLTAVAVKKEDEVFNTQCSSGGVSENHAWLCIDKEAGKQCEEICSVAGENSLSDKISMVPSSCPGQNVMLNRVIVHGLPSVEVKLRLPVKNSTKRSSCHRMDVLSSRSACSSGGVSENHAWLCIDKEAGKQCEEICSVAGENSLSDKISMVPSSCPGQNVMLNRVIVHGLPSVEVKLRLPVKNSTKQSSCHRMDVLSSRSAVSLPAAKVKIEPLDNSNLHNLYRNANGNAFNMLTVKSEIQTHDEINGDNIDHMLLQDRLNLMKTGEDPALSFLKNSECSEFKPTAVGCSPTILESVKPISIKCPRKRKKTATDSIETAMEEDAPGLLQILLDKGITVDEIKLYGETENDDPLDESFTENSFADLEDVISKLFSQRHSLLKFDPIKCTKEGSKATYCLACLFSLVEQTRYLQFKKWPVEWGWCRDLQSFIFVFQRHRRIVLERPEYGFATYFFELVDSLPIHWQVKRLVIAMKLTSCSRATIIENKVLSVGEDLSEGEARVLMEYGWIPNTGLGTMLNYCDRVVHDRKNVEDSSEWRSKIGKLLMDGYNSGTKTVLGYVNEYMSTEIPEIKQELF